MRGSIRCARGAAASLAVVAVLGLARAQEPASDPPAGNFQALSLVERYWRWRWSGDASILELSACPFSLNGKEVLDEAGLQAKLAELQRGAEGLRKKISAIDLLRVDFVEYEADSFPARLEPHKAALGIHHERLLAHARQLLRDGDLCLVMRVRLHRRGKDNVEDGDMWLLLSRTPDGYKLRGFQVS